MAARTKDDPPARRVAPFRLELRAHSGTRSRAALGGTGRSTSSPSATTKRRARRYPGVYGRMKWDEPAPTLTTQFYGFGNGRFGHPDAGARHLAARRRDPSGIPAGLLLRPRRASRSSSRRSGRMIGNAVPVDLGRVIGAEHHRARRARRHRRAQQLDVDEPTQRAEWPRAHGSTVLA